MDEPGDGLDGELRAASAPVDDLAADRWRARVAERLFGRTAPVVAIGRYRVLEAIGTGAAGVVYAAVDPELDRKVALKVLRDGPAASHDALVREAKVLAKLSHPNVVPVYDVGVHEGRVFVTLELVDGATLRQWLATPRTREEVVGVFVQAGRGLAAAHAAGVVHRDFKPENVLIGRDGRVRVSDFGIARALAAAEEIGTSTPSGSDPARVEKSHPAGTPAYMAPEQFLGDPIDARTDQFGFCVALHEAVYGQRPFAGRDRATLAANVIAGRRRVPREGAVPRWLERVIARGLRTDPTQRWPDMGALLDALVPVRRRSPARWAVVALGGAGFVAAIIASGRSSGGTDLCAGASERVAEVWSAERGQRIRAAFGATGLPYADDRSSRIVDELDRFAQSWSSVHASACEGVDDALAVRRVYCLQTRLLELDSLAGVLAEADADVVEHAARSGNGLRNPADCLFVAEDGAAVPTDVDGRDEHAAELRRTIARARAMGDTSRTERLRNALELARDAARTAQDLADRSLESEALLVAGTIEIGLVGLERDIDPATTIYAAVLAAEAAHRPDLVAQALVEYVAVMVDGGEYERAHTWAPRARAAVAAIGSPPELAGRIDMALALALGMQMRHDEALVVAQAALESFERGGEGSRRWLSVAVNLVGEMKFEQGHYLEARPYYERTLDIAVDALGTMHARVANGHGNLAETYFVLGDLAQAEQHFRDSLAIRREVFGDASVWTIHSYAHVGDVLYERGRIEDALATYEHALAIRLALQPARERPKDDDDDVPTIYRDLQTIGQEAWLRNGIAQCLLELGRLDDALAQAEQTTAVELPADRQHPDLVGRIDMHGQVLLAQGRWDEARVQLEAAVERVRAGYPVAAPFLAWGLVGLGRANVELGRHADAISPLEEALGLLAATPHAHLRLQAHAQLALARARWALGRNEPGRAAARAAAAAFVAAPHRGRGELEAVQAWLTTHP